MHFICLDKRVKHGNETYVVLSNGQQILLPSTVTKVPALLLLNRGQRVLFGSDINKHIFFDEVSIQKKVSNLQSEPSSFAFETNGNGVASDNFSFLDQGSDEMLAKGNGGMRQQHHYAGFDYSGIIETPPDNYTANKIGDISVEQLQQKRNSDIQI
jgi:hypothetical protein